MSKEKSDITIKEPKKERKKGVAKAKTGKESKTSKTKNVSTPGLWRTIRDGRSLSLTFFKRNGWLILLAMVAVIWLISQRYTNQSRMEEIKRLEKELRRAESAQLDAKADYMSLIRESKMRELMERNNLSISYQEQPPFVLSSD